MIRYRGIQAIRKYNEHGEPYNIYQEIPAMPRIDDRFLDCSIYLYVNKKDADKGHNVGASGVLVACPAPAPTGNSKTDALIRAFIIVTRSLTVMFANRIQPSG